ncbi:homeobox-leucine zipper family protein [Actinidia rufa]|uniref:Homeobox-leucine zipper family protein n=1 Tax=Actinidia rufa TaxID=165716 RepID=A0A7J0GCI8_9ERIC|nr:homeobox-leucine zipper family protein [Actinidia rufa]
MAVTSACKEGKMGMDNGKYVRYTPEQVEALERVYHECPKPSSLRRQQLIRECPILCNIEPKQIKVWFQNRRCREKQRKEASRLQVVNRKLSAMNKLLMEENDRLQKQVSQLVYENGYFRQQTQNAKIATTDTSCESVVTTGQNHLTQHPPRDASPAGLLSIADETLTEFLSKATGTAVEWVQMPGMKPGPDSIGIIAILTHGCTGVAARACGLVGLEPTRVAEILKDRPSWYRDCRAVDVLNVLSTGNGGTIELLYLQLYAPTTLAPARDFWLLRYTSVLDDGSHVVCLMTLNVASVEKKSVCERSLNNTQNGPRGGSIIHIVDHMDLEPWSVPEVLRPLYESSTLLAQRTTMAALRQLRQISQEVSQPTVTGWGRRPAALCALSQRLSKGFNEAVNGFTDEGWSMIEGDGIDDVTLLVNSSPGKMLSTNPSYANGFPSISNAVLCAKASMLLQNVPPSVLLRFLREHRSEWADSGIDAYAAAAAVKADPCSLPSSRAGTFGGQFMEVIKIENFGHYRDDMIIPGDIFLLQLCSGVDENAIGTCAELIFAPIDTSFSDDAPLLPSGFRVIPLDSGTDASSPNRTLDLTSALEVGTTGNRNAGDYSGHVGSGKSVMTLAFQFAFEIHLQENVAAMACQYVRSIIASVQRVALALSPTRFSSHAGLLAPPGTPEAHTLACWICLSYRAMSSAICSQLCGVGSSNGIQPLHIKYGVRLLAHIPWPCCKWKPCALGMKLVEGLTYLVQMEGAELLKPVNEGSESILKTLWYHSEAVMCCSLKELPVFTFANQAGLDMLETTLVALQDITLEKILDDHGRRTVFSELPQIMQQGFACLHGGICLSSMGRTISYERAVAWKVLNDEETAHCICFMFINWSFV